MTGMNKLYIPGTGRRNYTNQDIARLHESDLFDASWYLSTYPDVVTLGMDPAEHYLYIGAYLGRLPSTSFNTVWYLDQYPDVYRAGMNPLLHYLKFGRNAGHQIMPAAGWNGELPRGCVDVYISCWLKQYESLHDGLTDFAGLLAGSHIRCVFITNSEPLLTNPKLETIRTTFSIMDERLYRDSLAGGSSSAPWLQEVAAVQRARLEYENPDATDVDWGALMEDVERAETFWRELLGYSRPKLFLIWGSTSPLSKLHMHLCNELGIPFLIIERGHFSKTLSVDVLAQGAYGAINLLPLAVMPVGLPSDSDQIREIIDWVRACPEVPYPLFNQDSLQDDRLRLAGESGRKIILFIGSNDVGAGIAYTRTDTAENPSFLFSSTHEALFYVSNLLAQIDPDAVLVFKPHPADRYQYADRVQDNLIIAHNANINDLIMSADVCITLATTAIARAIVEAKPVVLLALNDASMKDIAYECRDFNDIPVMLRAALHRDRFDQKSRSGYAFLQYLFHYQLIGTASDVPARCKIPDLARLVEKRIRTFSRTVPAQGLDNTVDLARPVPDPALPGCSYRVWPLEPDLKTGQETACPVAVIIVVSAGRPVAEGMLDNLLNSTGILGYDIIIISDGQTDPSLRGPVKNPAYGDRVSLYTNNWELGPVASINRGLEIATGYDVVLLDSETMVPYGWLDRLAQAARSIPAAGSVSPLSNYPGIHMAPTRKGIRLDGGIIPVTEYDNMLQRNNSDYIELPVGNVCCMYIKQACLALTGYFDEGRSVNKHQAILDYSLGLRLAGFVNVCATNIFVGYAGEIKSVISHGETDMRFQQQYRAEVDMLTSIDVLAAYRS